MSDFGAVYDYALQLEATIPPGTMAELEAIRPACLGLTKRQKEEREKLAAMSPEDRIKGLSLEDRIKGLSLEDLIKGLSPEEQEQLQQLLLKAQHPGAAR